MKNGHTGIVKFLLGQGAAPDVRSGYSDFSALAAAASKGHEEIVSLLIDAYGYDLSGEGLALEEAAGNGHENIVRILLENGLYADTDAVSTAMVNSMGNHLNVFQLLLEEGNCCDLEYSWQGETFLMGAIYEGDEKAVQLLLEKGANPNMKRVDERPPM